MLTNNYNMGFAAPAPRVKKTNVFSENAETANVESKSNKGKERDDSVEASASDATGTAPESNASHNRNVPPLEYEAPVWSENPERDVFFEILKNGSQLDNMPVPLKPFSSIGRLPNCDMSLEHPSISRYHAVLQFGAAGQAYIYDLGSVHKTILNKQAIRPREYVKLKSGDQLRFGQSTRLMIFNDPKQDQAIAHVQDERYLQAKERFAKRKENREESERAGVSWGIADDDAIEEGIDASDDVSGRSADSLLSKAKAKASAFDIGGELYDASKSDAQIIADALKSGNSVDMLSSGKDSSAAPYEAEPKKYLRAWFERYNVDCHFEVEEEGPSHAKTYTARVKLPVDDEDGSPAYGNGCAGKRRDAERDAALDACRKLEKKNLLRPTAGQDSGNFFDAVKKRVRELFHGDDDDDDFTDNFYDATRKHDEERTGDSLEKMDAVETLDTLTEKVQRFDANIALLEAKIAQGKADASATMKPMKDEDDELDQYVDSLKNSLEDEKVSKLENELARLQTAKQRFVKLINRIYGSVNKRSKV